MVRDSWAMIRCSWLGVGYFEAEFLRVRYQEQRKLVLETLIDRGIIITDTLAQSLHIDLANMYLKLKRSGRI